MKFNPEDLPTCEKIITGHFYYTKEGDKIEKGDLIQIIAPKSMYHKFVCIFNWNTGYNISIIYKCLLDDGTVMTTKWDCIDPPTECLTWEDFKIVKLNSLEEAEK